MSYIFEWTGIEEEKYFRHLIPKEKLSEFLNISFAETFGVFPFVIHGQDFIFFLNPSIPFLTEAQIEKAGFLFIYRFLAKIILAYENIYFFQTVQTINPRNITYSDYLYQLVQHPNLKYYGAFSSTNKAIVPLIKNCPTNFKNIQIDTLIIHNNIQPNSNIFIFQLMNINPLCLDISYNMWFYLRFLKNNPEIPQYQLKTLKIHKVPAEAQNPNINFLFFKNSQISLDSFVHIEEIIFYLDEVTSYVPNASVKTATFRAIQSMAVSSRIFSQVAKTVSIYLKDIAAPEQELLQNKKEDQSYLTKKIFTALSNIIKQFEKHILDTNINIVLEQYKNSLNQKTFSFPPLLYLLIDDSLLVTKKGNRSPLFIFENIFNLLTEIGYIHASLKLKKINVFSTCNGALSHYSLEKKTSLPNIRIMFTKKSEIFYFKYFTLKSIL